MAEFEVTFEDDTKSTVTAETYEFFPSNHNGHVFRDAEQNVIAFYAPDLIKRVLKAGVATNPSA